MPICLNPLALFRLSCVILSVLAGTVHRQDPLIVKTPIDTSEFLFSGNSDLLAGAFIVTSLPGVAGLASFLDRNPGVTVTHLFLSDFDDRELQTKLVGIPLDGETMYGHRMILHDLMNHVSPTLEVLSYSLYHWNWTIHFGQVMQAGFKNHIPRLFDHEFPRLRQLTLQDVDIWEDDDCEQIDPDLPDCIFPSLPSVSHLHLVSKWAYDKKLPTLTSLKESLPALTHLRLTATPLTTEMWPKTAEDGSEHYYIPSNLTVLYNPSFYPLLGDSGEMMCGTPGVMYDDMMERLGALTPDHHMRLIWPLEENYKRYGSTYGIYPVGRAIRDFRSRLFGEGEGDWSVTEVRPWTEPMGDQWWLKTVSED
ncbi:hypothetical protein K435DRAFT_838893 [Dendrothele bispora CBS 962.96]|uniref:F-box domain-containing protein n=1 Tax=Dendrothele bispora (strain CBS 962.96) TaxID=1314807 RepID=A0A4S8M3Y6_DENBC|nr:hypothetical protein K435DRAFT_838893 [Dendrothele bispora CBS 962.96]